VDNPAGWPQSDPPLAFADQADQTHFPARSPAGREPPSAARQPARSALRCRCRGGTPARCAGKPPARQTSP